ncbi:hypothetical protein HN51_030518 [Arachis hypogaea]|uniref:SCP domain-containing protein n=2 Tax=Arachis TaxID=3817 RepID=A0A445BAW9_ARAHY|nr:pathogenesis-related protein 1-like [Arachis duranensis]QHO15013.1 Pathogenesis-related protein [Arachis hypogaea]RYR35833.1 hypothetical protein Ahy_A10g050932 [Arachis hypogaea]
MGDRDPRISIMLVALMIALTLAITSQVSYAQNSPQDYLNAHNAARAQVGVAPMWWDSSLAGYAQNHANSLRDRCQLVHSGGPYGENLAWSSADLTGTAAVKLWVDEKQYYDYNSNTCASGKVCGHYTQVVWRDSVRLGCAKVRCSNGQSTIISCNYDPPGNFIDQWPYDISPFQVPLSFNKNNSGLDEN